MNWLVFHIASGQAFFSGAACLLLAAWSSLSVRPWAKRATLFLGLLGLTLVVLSSTPLPFWYYGLTTLLMTAWLVTLCSGRENITRWRTRTALAVAVAWAGAIAWELPYHLPPTPAPVRTRAVTVIGDSITAGLGDTRTWPQVLADEHHLQVQDISHVGDTARKALARIQAEDIEIQAELVLVEIGGNDVLGSTTTSEFATALDALLQEVAIPGRQVLMFELPLPPLAHEFGRVQRTLAARHGVRLIPKRALLSVLAQQGATTDSIHLSPDGHQAMAARVWQIIAPAFPSYR